MVNCEVCGNKFKNNAGLAGHLRLSHPDYAPVETRELVECIDALSKGLAIVANNQIKVTQVLERQERDLGTVLQVLRGELILGKKG
ncbi:hypothetical protein ES705_41139 [subsurface metagenome]